MKIEQFYTGCLSQGAYYIESDGQAAVIDPLREVQSYLDLANSRNASIKYIFETHFHADFVSGHITLSKKTGAPIVFGPLASPNFDSIIAQDMQVFEIGTIKIKVLHTPGHTMESTTYLLIDEEGKDHAIFTGDTLFLGDVGRPDLAQKAANMTQDQLAGLLFQSLRSKIMTLSDDIIVYPGHGAGSACGKFMSKETVGTLGHEKQTNYALRENMTKKEFIDEVTNGLQAPPAYFPHNVKLNKEGYEDIDHILKNRSKALNVSEFENLKNETDAIILDVRHQKEFSASHIPNSIFVGLDGSFAPWVGAILKDVNQAILLLTPQERTEETITRLSRVGFDNVLGYLEGGIHAWKEANKPTDCVNTISAEDFASLKVNHPIHVIDVRKVSEFENSHIKDALNIPLSQINSHFHSLSTDTDNYVHCAGGYRSMIANSVLKSKGIHNVVDVLGGFSAIKSTDTPIITTSLTNL